MRMWKWVGLAGIVGAAAVGIAVGANAVKRKRREFVDANPDELRTRLHERFREAQATSDRLTLPKPTGQVSAAAQDLAQSRTSFDAQA